MDRVSIVPLCWSMDDTCVPSSKVPEGTQGLVYQRQGVNLHEIVGTRLDDISKQACKDA